MAVVYFDQNKWIELARVFHGKESAPDLQEIFEIVQTRSRRGDVIFPLSGVHYMETAKIRDPGRRSALGTVMWEISRGNTLASYRRIICHELEVALSRRFEGVTPGQFRLVSKGFSHALGIEYSYRLPNQYRGSLPREVIEALESEFQKALEKAVITGEGPRGLTMPPFRHTEYNRQFKEHLETLHPKVSKLPRDQWEDALYAMAIADIQSPINEVLGRHNLSSEDLTSLGKDGLTTVVDELPSRRVEIQLHKQVLKNPQLKPKITDLEDWSGLGPAAAHCDIIVCEKHFADLLLRDGFRPKARVITQIKDLPAQLQSTA